MRVSMPLRAPKVVLKQWGAAGLVTVLPHRARSCRRRARRSGDSSRQRPPWLRWPGSNSSKAAGARPWAFLRP